MVLASLPIITFVDITITIRCEEQHQALADQEMRRILLYFIPQTLFRVNAEFTSTPSHYMTNQSWIPV